MDSRLDLADSRLGSIEKVVSNLEEERKRDRKEILDVLDTMQKSIDKQFKNMHNYMNAQFEKFDAINAVNNIEHTEFKQLLQAYGIRMNLQNSRIVHLEDWKNGLEDNDIILAH